MAYAAGSARAPRRVKTLGAAAVFLVSFACRREPTSAEPVTYAASLAGSAEVPPNRSVVTGVATFEESGSRIRYSVSAGTFGTPLTVGHVHFGGPGVVGPVLVPFTFIAQSGVVATGTIDVSQPITWNTFTITGDSLRALLRAGQAYVNLHTAAYPGGEIRGQIAPASGGNR